jgi:hypothetical protein
MVSAEIVKPADYLPQFVGYPDNLPLGTTARRSGLNANNDQTSRIAA